MLHAGARLRERSRDEMVRLYEDWVRRYPICSIEDGLAGLHDDNFAVAHFADGHVSLLAGESTSVLPGHAQQVLFRVVVELQFATIGMVQRVADAAMEGRVRPDLAEQGGDRHLGVYRDGEGADHLAAGGEELPADRRQDTSHVSRVDLKENGKGLKILRQSLPYGTASGKHGLFFIAYCARLHNIEQQLLSMFGDLDGKRDAMLRFSRAVTGSYYFAPSLTRLLSL